MGLKFIDRLINKKQSIGSKRLIGLNNKSNFYTININDYLHDLGAETKKLGIFKHKLNFKIKDKMIIFDLTDFLEIMETIFVNEFKREHNMGG